MPTINRYPIVLADDHVILRQGLRMILEQKAGLKMIGEVSDGFELLDLLDTLIPHMVILDISMQKLRGIEATRRIKDGPPSCENIDPNHAQRQGISPPGHLSGG